MNNMTTGQRIASRRKLANLSQEDISQELGVSRQAISKWESDAGLPDIDNLIALSKRFGVSVGWLLGTEADPNFDPSTGLSDAQLKMVEEIIVRNKPKSQRTLIAAGLAAVILILSVFGTFFQHQLGNLSAENAAAQGQIAALEQSNQTLVSQMDAMNATLEQQSMEDDLLLNVHPQAHLNEDEQTVVLDFYLTPKLYQENAEAYLMIYNGNADTPWFETISCQPVGNWYHCRAELPVRNGYRYSFLLSTGNGYQEQVLDDVSFVRYFNNLYDATRYHLAASAEQRSVWYASNTDYTFSQPISSPVIDFRTPYVGYEEVDVTLYRNGEPIHTQSLRAEFKEHGGAYMRFEEPYPLDIHAQLPQLEVGDTLTLEIAATNYDGKTLTNVLETLEVVE